jgi:hypothetical protein
LFNTVDFEAMKRILQQTWVYFKTNWFITVVGVLLLAAVLRNNVRVSFGGGRPAEKPAAADKFTGKQAGSMGHMGLIEVAAAGVALPEVGETAAVAFLRRYKATAQGEMRKFGVPASVLLALAYVNSFAGSRPAADQANNLFALPCTTQWDGATVGVEGRCYRRYDTSWESFRDHSIHLAAQDWYGDAKKRCGADWKAWLQAVDEHGLSDVQGASSAMRDVIARYRLYELDR